MSHSTDEDDQRSLRSGRIGVVESEGQGVLLQEAGQESREGESEIEGFLLQEAGQENHEEESAAESCLVIAESSGEEEVVESLAGWSLSVLNVVVGSERLMMMTDLMTQALRVQVTMTVQTVTMLVQCIRQEVIHATIWTIYVI